MHGSSIPNRGVHGKHVLSFVVVPAITRAATSDNTGAADSPYNLILKTKSRRPRSQVSGTETPPTPALLEQARIDLAVGMWFLYMVLGWLVWVGVASIILLVPVPGYMARLVQSVQRERLKRTDDGVQSIGEAVEVLRMGKQLDVQHRGAGGVTEMVDRRECVVAPTQTTHRLNATIMSKVSLDRVAQFLEKTESSDSFAEEKATLLHR
ncbi:hypothetical protein DFH08DRAFT_1090225 [Mycena albidolilacea]|uniref:Uncharacterized protein n=1 Tax=Mycena albidolilacea TaxID=1033008 RepID=A0AAD6YXS6_9AGAR|nr:hypothetical protein DFH08DRAFT_1090225 [Mycena albidolilacea]